jgi:hypothetical protein
LHETVAPSGCCPERGLNVHAGTTTIRADLASIDGGAYVVLIWWGALLPRRTLDLPVSREAAASRKIRLKVARHRANNPRRRHPIPVPGALRPVTGADQRGMRGPWPSAWRSAAWTTSWRSTPGRR